MHPTKRPFDNLLRPKFLKLYRLPFSRYSSFKFWSRDYHVIMTSQKFFIWLRKCPFSQHFIWGAAIGRTCFGSRDIWLLNFDHVTTWSRDFFKKIQIAHATPHPRGNWLWGIFFVHSLNPGRIVPPKNYHVIYYYIYSLHLHKYIRGLASVCGGFVGGESKLINGHSMGVWALARAQIYYI